MDILYTAEAPSTGAGRDGHVTTTDGRIDFDMALPKTPTRFRDALPR
jgi:lipoyl-dependent peroxiredoxin